MSDFRVLIFAARAHKTAIFGFLLAGLLVAAIVNLLQPIAYTTSAFLFVATPNWNDSTAIADPNAGGSIVSTYGDQFTQQRMVSYGKLGTSDLVLDNAAKRLGGTVSASELRGQVIVQPVPETVMLEVRATDSSAPGAVNAANAVAASLVETIENLERPDREVSSPVQPLIIRPASLPLSPTAPQLILNLLVGGAIGVLAGVTFAAWRTGVGLKSAAAISEMLHTGDALGVLPLSTDEAGDPASDESAHLLGVRLRPILKSHSAALVLIASPRGDTEAGAVAQILARAFCASQITATSVRAESSNAESVNDDANAFRSLLNSNEYVFVASDGLLESARSVELGHLCDATILVCPASDMATKECAEAERLLHLTDTPHLGKLITSTNAAAAARTLDRALTSSSSAELKDV